MAKTKTLLEKMEAVNIELERVFEEGELDDTDSKTVVHTRKDMHPMSGQMGSFEFLDVDLKLTEEEDGTFKVHDTSKRNGGSIPGFLARELDSGDREWDDDDIYDLESTVSEEYDTTETFETLEKAMECMDTEFEG